MKFKLISLPIYSALLLSALAPKVCSQVHFNADERRIITITDERRDADSLLPYLASPNQLVARRAAIGIGNIGDTTVRAKLLDRFMHESRDTVADAEAFSLGLLGPDEQTSSALVGATFSHPTLERIRALARCSPKNYGASSAKIVGALADKKMIDHLTEAEAYIEFALHKEVSGRMMDDLEILTGDPDYNVRWRAVYALVRSDDSLDLADRLPKLKELLHDLGSPYVRMFAASALGKIHDSAAEIALARAYRGEEDWRVQVNILNAFTQFSRLDPNIFETIKLATVSALRDSQIVIHLGLAAQDVLEHFVISGTLTTSDSNYLREWLDGFNGTDGRNEEVSPSVSARATISAARLRTPTLYTAIQNYAQYNTPTIRNYSSIAQGTTDDTTYFSALLVSLPAFGPAEKVVRLIALDTMWQHAKHNKAFYNIIERNHTANVYRYALVHIGLVDADPAVVTTALNQMQDTTIVRDSSQRTEALHTMEKYIATFAEQRFRDQLLAALQAELWLKPDPAQLGPDTTRELVRIIRTAYDSANRWGDKEVLDSITVLIDKLEGASALLPNRLQRRSQINWNELESIPDKLILNFERGSVQMRLMTEDAPLTVLNMMHLARDQYFTGNVIHRVVPNFVIQSGDQSGTGWGGPGYTIRSEFTPLNYDQEGVVGMARDGKDTEGSQWFITQCPTPHLDARYTIWAQVTDGMDAVFQQNLGDKVDTIFPLR